MNAIEQAENLVEVRVARMETYAAVWNAVFSNSKHLGPIERSEIADRVGQYAAGAMLEATLAAQAKDGDK